MDIYKLSDSISEKPHKNPDYIVTDIKQSLHNENRVNIFINGKYAFSLDISQVVDFKIKIGLHLTESQYDEYKKASEFGKLYQRALEWILLRPHSEKETRDYLYKKIREKDLDKLYIDRVISRLKNKNYLNDEKFAKYYCENRFISKGISKKRLRMELMKKGIESSIIEEAISSAPRDDESEIKKIIAKKRKKYPEDEKLIQYLCRQGFSYEQVKSLVQSSETD